MKLPKLCIVGPLGGSHPEQLPTQADFLSKAFIEAGYSVISVSSYQNRFRRLIDIIWTLWRYRHWIDIQILQVFSGTSFIVSDIAASISKILGQRLIMILRGGNLPSYARRHPRWVKRVLYRADNIVVPSTYLARELSWLGLKFEIIPNTLDLSHYPYRQRSRLEPRLLWMRTFHQTYNPEMALNVLMRVMVLYPQATLTMAGLDAGLQKEIQKLAFNKGLMTHISFPGILDTPAKYLAGQLHDIYLNTNRVDNMPISIIEMAAMGLPIIATNVGGIPDLLTHGETALIVPSNDDQAMAEAVNCLLANPGLVKNLSINARQMAESFTWQKVSPLWDQLFSKVLKDA